MTITTAKTPDAAVFRLTPLALAALLSSTGVQAADWRVAPSVELRETYSDNLNSSSGNASSGGFVSEVAPGISVIGRSRRLQVNANSQLRRYFYHNSDAPNLRNGDLRYGAGAKAELVNDNLFVDANASGSRQTVSPFGPLANNGYSSFNNTNVRTWSISPYFVHQFGTVANAVVRVTRDSVTSGQSSSFGDTMGTTRSANLTSGSRFTDFTWGLTYSQQDITSSLGNGFRTENSVLSLGQRINRTFSLTASGLYDSYEYPALDQRTSGPGWTAGFIWTPSSRTNVSLSAGRRYFGNTASLDASHRTRHSTWRLTYSDGVTMSRSQFLLPTAVDTAGMLDSMFLATYPDAALRQQAVQAYMASTGLPPSLASNINFLTNRFVRNKRLQGTALLRGARSTMTFSIFKDERRALSLPELDNPLLGAQQNSLYDNTRQRGVSAAGDYRLNGRTSAHARLYAVRIQSLENNLVNNVKQVSLGVTRQLSLKSVASLDVRHSNGRADVFSNDKYRENAVVASLSVRY